jgi:YD repeat-containing protein
LNGQTKTTSYTYDEANQLLTATQEGVTWRYTYDGNGSLIQITPGEDVANGAKRYRYNTAGFLVKVETYTTDWQPQAEMAYDGLGNRLAMTGYPDGQSVTTQYSLDSGQTLLASAGEMTTACLYGLGAIGEQTDAWAYTLPDGTNTPRQTVDSSGVVTLTASYTPWGDTLEVHGTGSFTFGYFAGMMDTVTGLLYVGSGQYYDPQAGRFLTRKAKPNQINPYMPWQSDPAGAMLAPLAFLAMVYGKKKNRGKWDQWFILLVLCGAVGMSLSACSKDSTSPTQTPIPTSTPIEVRVTPTGTTVSEDNTPFATSTAVKSPDGGTCILILDHPEPNETEINLTIQALADYIFSEGKDIKALSEYAKRDDVESYLRRLMNEAGSQKLNTNHLAYIYATTHVESAWSDFEERYDGEKNEEAKKKFFENKYGKDTNIGQILGNTETWDGYTFLGRGFIHITGRANYSKISEELGLGDLLINGAKNGFAKAACGLKCDGYDYVTKIAVTGMAKGTFTGKGLLDPDLNGNNGSFKFGEAREIIGWPGDGSAGVAEKLAIGYARILSEHCISGGVSKGLICVNCN